MPRKTKPLTTQETIIKISRNLIDDGIAILESLDGLTNEQERTLRRALGKVSGASANLKTLVDYAEGATD